MSKPHGPLQGVKVVSCSTAQVGTVPYMLMADLGADVIKIETPNGGDTSRVASVLPGMPSTFFETNNRGVKSVTLDLKQPEAREILHRLVARADIFGQFAERCLEWHEILLVAADKGISNHRDRGADEQRLFEARSALVRDRLDAERSLRTS